jgi:hypothetical protein
MTTTTARSITRREFTDALECVGLNEYEITESYSGRGMYGASCFGVTVEPSNVRYVYAALGFAMGYASAEVGWVDEAEDAITAADRQGAADSLLGFARQDSMGRDVIVYFPSWALAD